MFAGKIRNARVRPGFRIEALFAEDLALPPPATDGPSCLRHRALDDHRLGLRRFARNSHLGGHCLFVPRFGGGSGGHVWRDGLCNCRSRLDLST